MAMLLTTKNWSVHWDIFQQQFELIISDLVILIYNDSFLVVKARDYRTLDYPNHMIGSNQKNGPFISVRFECSMIPAKGGNQDTYFIVEKEFNGNDQE